MKHLSHEQLWELAKQSPSAQRDSHVESCLTCTLALEDIVSAQRALALMPVAPPMPPFMASRVEAKLRAAIAQQRRRSWWPRLAGALLATSLVAGVSAVIHRPSETVEPPPLAAVLAPQPVLVREAPLREPEGAVVPKLTATVARAKKARSSNLQAALASSQVLTEGSSLSTEKGGALWLRLPDGSRAGLTGGTRMQLATLEPKALTLDLEQGTVSMVVPHREDRVLTVRAGELEVKDLGTQFVVSREAGRTVVTVEEGSVEVRVPGQTRMVPAGRAVSYRNGQLEDLAPLPALPLPPKKKPALASQPAAAQATAEAADESPPPPEALERSTEAPAEGLSGQPVLPAVAAKLGASLAVVERRVDEMQRALRASFEQGGSRAQRAKYIGREADSGDCSHAIDLANNWLVYAHDPPNELPLRREVLFQKMRCLRKLGRVPEAGQVRLEIESIAPK